MADGGTRVLVLRGGWEGHEPVKTSDKVIAYLDGSGFDVTISDSLSSYADQTLMESIDLVVQTWTMGEIAGSELDGLCRAIRSGTGLAGWHGGLCDAFRAATAYQFMTGGQWVAHPGGKIDYDVHILPEHAEHPVLAGIKDFSMHSEQYYLHVDPSNLVLATTTFAAGEEAPWIEGCVMPVVWTRSYGEGRVFYSSLGHDAADFDVPEVVEIAARGCRWAARHQR